jgi:hypothetical protein
MKVSKRRSIEKAGGEVWQTTKSARTVFVSVRQTATTSTVASIVKTPKMQA